MRGLVHFDNKGGALTLRLTGKQPEGGFAGLPAGEGAIFTWLNSEAGFATIDKAHGAAVAVAGDKFTKSIESENRNRFFRRNLGYVIAGLAMTASVIAGVVTLGGLQDQDISILAALCFGGFMLGVFAVPVLQALAGGGAKFAVLARAAMSLAFVAIFVSIILGSIPGILHSISSDALPALQSLLTGNPFPFVLVTAFTALNGLFFYLMRAPTALGRPIMDQLSGFKLYLETAEADRLNMQGAPEITAERFEALLPYAVALDVEKPWSDAFAAAVRRAHPGEADPMSGYQPAWSSGGGWSGRDFSSAVSSSVAGMSGALASAVPVSSGSSGFGGGGGSGGGGGGGGGGGW